MHSDSGKAGRGPFGVMNIGSVFKGQGPRPNPELSRSSLANVSRDYSDACCRLAETEPVDDVLFRDPVVPEQFVQDLSVI